jgi:hypothetical protein
MIILSKIAIETWPQAFVEVFSWFFFFAGIGIFLWGVSKIK